jgi:hypothetical protein
MCGGLDQMIPEWQEMVTDTCKHLGKSLDEFNADVEIDKKRLDDFFQRDEGGRDALG